MKKITLKLATVFFMTGALTNLNAQTNVYDDVIATSPDHTLLAAALQQEGLDVVLRDASGTFTVFAPDNDAINNLATDLGTDINGVLANPDLTNILLYHVLGIEALSSGLSNGDIVTPLNTANSLKLTVTSQGGVYVNQAMVNAADLTTDNGVVHSINEVVLPVETVVDVAIDNGFSSLATAVITGELIPALSDPFSQLTVFAPTNEAFDNLATALGTDINGILASPDLVSILTYHVLGAEVMSSGVTNGLLAQPLNNANTIKMSVTGNGEVYANQAQVTAVDVPADNGVVHIINEVILPIETVVDVAIDNEFTSLTSAVVKAELLPALTNPLQLYTVFAPTNQAFDDLATALGTDLNGVLNHPELANILLYHVVSGAVLSTDLQSGSVPSLLGQDLTVDLTDGVNINDATVTLADITVDNGVVHVVDMVILPSLASINENTLDYAVYPNPSSDYLQIKFSKELNGQMYITNAMGQKIYTSDVEGQSATIDISGFAKGMYYIGISGVSNSLTPVMVK